MTRVKVCGIKRLEHAMASILAGADFLGFVFWPRSRRFIEARTAREIIETCRADPALAGRTWKAVGVFVDPAPDVVDAVVRECGLDYVQLSGDESPDLCRQMPVPVIKGVRLPLHAGEADAETMEKLSAARYGVERLLIDSQVPGHYGGTGVAHDWRAARPLAKNAFLAGGLTPQNVARAIRIARPWGVDVSSGVERDGEKDADLIRQFIQEVRCVDRERSA